MNENENETDRTPQPRSIAGPIAVVFVALFALAGWLAFIYQQDRAEARDFDVKRAELAHDELKQRQAIEASAKAQAENYKACLELARISQKPVSCNGAR